MSIYCKEYDVGVQHYLFCRVTSIIHTDEALNCQYSSIFNLEYPFSMAI